MSVSLFANNANSTLAASIDSTATSVTLAPGTGSKFPSPGANQYFTATFVNEATGLQNEIVNVTARSGDVLTIVRAQEGTIALNWNAGDFCSNFLTAGTTATFLQQGQAQSQTGNYAVDTGAADAMVIALSPAPTSLTALLGTPIRILVNATNATAAPSLNVNGLGAHAVVAWQSAGSTQVAIGTFAAGKIIEVTWDGTEFQFDGQMQIATKAQIQGTSTGPLTVTAANFNAAFPGNHATGGPVNGGYQYLPGGLILQWGNSLSTGASPVTVSYPIAFTANPVITIGTTENPTGALVDPYFTIITAVSTSSFNVQGTVWTGSAFANASGGFTFNWMAIGQAALP